MSFARYCLFKLIDGAAVGAIGSTVVNCAAMFVGVEGVDTGKIAGIMAAGSLLYGILRGEFNFAWFPEDTVKYTHAKNASVRMPQNASRLSKFAETAIENNIGNTFTAGFGFTAYASLALVSYTSPSFYDIAKLFLCAAAGSAVETAYQPYVPRIRLK